MKPVQVILIRVLWLPLLLGVAVLSARPVVAFSQAAGPEWTPPVNLSRSGGASNPAVVVDSAGVRHAIWVDAYAGFVYSKGEATGWTEPAAVIFPFSPPLSLTDSSAAPIYPTPRLMADQTGRIHAFWIDDQNQLYHSSVSETAVGNSDAWPVKQLLADSALAMDVYMDPLGNFHLAYIHNLSEPNAPSGVYYRSLITRGYVWNPPVILEETPYFRSITPEAANVSVSASLVGNALNVFVAWDNQPRNRISVVRSADAGRTWGAPVIVDGPEVSAGPVMPRNVRVGAYAGNTVLVWQVEQPGGNCTQNYEWSNDAGESWQGKQRMLIGIQGCAESNQFFIGPDGLMLLMTRVLGQVYLHAWDGSRWSDPQYQEILSSFVDEETFNLVSLDCQYANLDSSDTLTVAGCDTGVGGDIWLTSRQIGPVGGWFSATMTWSLPVSVVSSQAAGFSDAIMASSNGMVHLLWSQVGVNTDGLESSTLQYSRWDGRNWSAPTAVFGAPLLNVDPPSATIYNERLYVVFADQASGQLNFTSVDSGQATDTRAWNAPVTLPVPRPAAGSPQIYAAEDGSLYIVYSIPINEQRGIYWIRSDDGGSTWSAPVLLFDAVKANWPVVDHPQLAFTDPQHFYLIFTQYALPGRNRPLGLYFTRSADGGATWAEPQPVSEEPTYWSAMRSVGKNSVHIAWQELSNGSYTVWHNLTMDNGQTWMGRNSLSSSASPAMLSPLIVDKTGQTHLLQSTQEEGSGITLTHWIWNGPQWSISELTRFETNSPDNANALLGVGTPDGRLVVVYSIFTQPLNEPGGRVNTVYSTQRTVSTENQAAAVEAAPTEAAAVTRVAVAEATASAAPTRIAETPAIIIAPVGENRPPADHSPVVRQNQWIGLIIGVAVAVIVVIGIFIFGLRSVKNRGLR